jgi:hypothetical protein
MTFMIVEDRKAHLYYKVLKSKHVNIDVWHEGDWY